MEGLEATQRKTFLWKIPIEIMKLPTKLKITSEMGNFRCQNVNP